MVYANDIVMVMKPTQRTGNIKKVNYNKYTYVKEVETFKCSEDKVVTEN
jgi:hypothetical protein